MSFSKSDIANFLTKYIASKFITFLSFDLENLYFASVFSNMWQEKLWVRILTETFISKKEMDCHASLAYFQ